MALGEILKNARVAKGLTPSDVAESTHMMVQIVESLEREDFRRIAAPIYGRGFVKLYAEFMELDPEPLIRDFMELYDGARMPAVRTKKVEASEPPVAAHPVTRTVSGPAPLAAPERQPVQPRPLVRPVVPVAESAEEPKVVVSEEVASDQAERVGEVVSPADEVAAAPIPWVVEPEEAYDDTAEPDLFRPARLRRRQDVEASDEPDAPKPRRRRLPKLPIFKIGGRMDERADLSEQDEAAHAKRHARVESFINGFSKLRDGLERSLPDTLSPQKVWILGGVGLAAVVLLGTGIRVLFKMTGSGTAEAPHAIIERVSPPPDMYID